MILSWIFAYIFFLTLTIIIIAVGIDVANRQKRLGK